MERELFLEMDSWSQLFQALFPVFLVASLKAFITHVLYRSCQMKGGKSDAPEVSNFQDWIKNIWLTYQGSPGMLADPCGNGIWQNRTSGFFSDFRPPFPTCCGWFWLWLRYHPRKKNMWNHLLRKLRILISSYWKYPFKPTCLSQIYFWITLSNGYFYIFSVQIQTQFSPFLKPYVLI